MKRPEYDFLSTDENAINTSICSKRYGSYIIMGKDKNNTTDQYGLVTGKQSTTETSYDAGSIDLFVGLNVMNKKNDNNPIEVDSNGDLLAVKLNSDFSKDAARIYISERSDPDTYFNINTSSEKGSLSYQSLSTVTLISDATRIIGRNSLKIVTSGAKEINSTGKSSFTAGQIQLIAGNRPEDLQPMVRGHNLVDYLKKQNKRLQWIIDHLLTSVLEDIGFLWNFASTHVHPVPALGTSSPSPGAVANAPARIEYSISASKKLLEMTQKNALEYMGYLEPSLGSNYILSKKVSST